MSEEDAGQSGDDGKTGDEEIDPEKFAAFQNYIRQEREMEKRRSRRGRGCGGCLLKSVVAVLVVGGIAWGVVWLHPWGHETKVYPAEKRTDACEPGQRGELQVTYFTLFGVRAWEMGRSEICVEE